MDNLDLIKEISLSSPTKILLLVIDGLGGLPHPKTGRTELETASTPNLDRLAKKGICGLIDPVSPGITPGSTRPTLPSLAMTRLGLISGGGWWRRWV